MFLLAFLFALKVGAVTTPLSSFPSTTPPLGIPQNIQHLWANSAPYFPAAEYPPPPLGCHINQVNTVDLVP